MSRRAKLLLAAGAACALAAAAIGAWLLRAPRGPVGRPPDPTHEAYNVVLVSIDTLRADRLGCYGYDERPTSPVIDRLAEEGVLFERYVASAPWTTPSHASLLTSLYPSSHGVTMSFSEMWEGLRFGETSFHRLPGARVTLAEVLGSAGYATAAFTGGGPVDPAIGFEQGFERYETTMFKLDEENVGDMFEWLAGNADRRFFLFWHHFEAHAPYLHPEFVDDAAPADAAAAIAEETRAMAAQRYRDVWPGDAALLRNRQMAALRRHGAFDRDVCEALYTGNVRSADAWLGRLIDELRRLGVYDRTLLVVSSDHGEEFADHNAKLWYNHHGHTVYEEMIHVPLIIKLPNGYAAGTRVPAICETVDVMPTILDVLAVAPAPDEMQGRSLAPLWRRPDAGADDRAAFTESTVARNEKKSVRAGRYKYIVNVDKATVAAIGRRRLPDGPLRAELYDLEADPREKHNLLRRAPRGDNLALAAQLERRLRQHLAAQRGEAEKTTLGADALARLRSLGYIGDDAADAGVGDAGR